MSKLADLLKSSARAAPGALGFGASTPKKTATMLLVALVGEQWANGTGEAVSAGADAVLLTGTPGEKELAAAVAAADSRPCGLLDPQADAEAIAALRKAGLDFLTLGAEAPASALLDEKLALLLHLNEELTDIELRTLDSLSLEAIYLERSNGPLTIRRQMELRRVSGLARTPLLLAVQSDIEEQELLSLREAGVALVALDLRERGAADALRRLRGVIDGLPSRRSRNDERGAVTIGQVASKEPEEEEEEEE